MKLSIKQQLVFDSVINGNNVFLTGPGGTGKTALIKEIYNKIHSSKNIQLTAMTGVAAIQLHETAKTLHSWAGIGIGDQSVNTYILKIRRSNALLDKWKKIQILVIDEVSMLSDELFNKLEELARVIKQSTKPFGGIQILMSGDFYQLPPVKNNSRFCFESDKFDSLFNDKIVLDTIFRQQDEVFVKILQNIRLGKITQSNIRALQERLIKSNDNIEPVILMPKKSAVDEINTTNLSNIDSEPIIFSRKILEDLEVTKEEKQYLKLLSAEEYSNELNFLEKSTVINERVELKVGAKVMSIVNVEEDEKLIISNGTQGVVKSFVNGLPFVQFENGISQIVYLHIWKCHSLPCCGICQIPLILSWALTIHKAQGCTLTRCRMNIGSDIFESGQTYVALSRVKSLDGIYLDSFNPHRIKVNPKVKEFYDIIKFN